VRDVIVQATRTQHEIGRWMTEHLSARAGIVALSAVVVGPLVGLALAAESWYVVVLLGLVVLIPVVVRWPVISTFGVYAFLVPFDAVTVIPGAGGATLTRLFGILSAGVLLASLLIRRWRLVRPPAAALWWGLVVLLATLSAAWALDPGLVRKGLSTALSIFLLYLVAVSFRPTRKELLGVCVLAVLGGAIAAGFGFNQEQYSTQVHRGTLRFSDERKANPNALAAALVLPFALALGGSVRLRGVVSKAAAIMAVGVIGAGIYLTESRKALLAAVVMMLVFLYRLRQRSQALIVVMVLLGLIAAVPQAFSDRIEAVFSGEDATGSGRTEIWSVGIGALERFGILGAGLGNFPAVYGREVLSGRVSMGAHNTYLSIWVELGIVGLVLMFAAVTSHLSGVHRSMATAGNDVVLCAVEAASLGILIIAFFADSLWEKYVWLIWILSTWATRTGAMGEYKESGAIVA
jgi:O-antigen ligase